MNRLILLFSLCVLTLHLPAQQPLTYYLPDISYDPAVPTPESFFGHQVGEWHLSHDKLVYYLRALAKASPRVAYTEYGRSHEGRPMVYLTITSPANQQRLPEIQAAHVALSDPNSKQAVEEGQPVVLYQGFSIHGNEPSGGNAAPLIAYYLAAGQSAEVQQTLEQAVVLLDPCFNPDGFHRFSTWVNMHKNQTITTDPADREYSEAWPGGRTNHYWFDLNRDWLLVQHPESKGRIRLFHDWKPNVLTDHHEMGSNSTFFFMPGIPSRTNPITPPLNQELTGRIGDFHAAALDEIGSLYYTKESFDDFYLGKGSTYPDVCGSIGILFEQASSRGHAQETDNGVLDFPFTIRNQVRTALSTQRAGISLRKELLEYQRDFYRAAMEEARKDSRPAYVFGDAADPVRLAAFVELLRRHEVEVYELKEKVESEGQSYEPGSAYLVPMEQPQYRLIRGMFETQTSFTDSIFYDVSTWTLPLAFGLPYAALGKGTYSRRLLGDPVKGLGTAPSFSEPARSTYAYLLEWESYAAPRALQQLLAAGLRAKVATKPFELEGRSYQPGTVLLPVQNQDKDAEALHQLMVEAAKAPARITAVATGLTPEGIDLGSGSFRPLKATKVLLLVGSGVSPYEAGAAWHLMDERYGIPVSMVELGDLDRTDLSRYTVIVMVDGSYGSISSRGSAKIKDWAQSGGTLVAIKRAASWAKAQGLAQFETRTEEKNGQERRPYAMLSPDQGADRIGGAIMEAIIDLSHPLFYGYQEERLPVFQRGTTAFEPTKNAYATPAVYADAPLLSGYARGVHQEQLAGSAAAVVSGIGSGRTICLPIDPNFRGFWYGTNRLFANSLFFGSVISSSGVER